MPDNAHRGRVQAQGRGVQESVSWSRDEPPTAADGHGFLNELHALLSSAEQKDRSDAFVQAHRFVDRAALAGGSQPVKKSYPYPPRRDGRRVDIEIIKGIAFVPDNHNSTN